MKRVRKGRNSKIIVTMILYYSHGGSGCFPVYRYMYITSFYIRISCHILCYVVLRNFKEIDDGEKHFFKEKLCPENFIPPSNKCRFLISAVSRNRKFVEYFCHAMYA